MVSRGLAALLMPWILAGAAPAHAGEPVSCEPAWPERHFDTGPDAVQAALVAAIAQQGLSIDPDAAAQPGETVTLWRRFRPEDFGPSVALDTPTIGRDYPYVSPIRLRQGTYRLRARVLSRPGGASLALRAELLADAYNFEAFEAQQVERLSNGVIEAAVFARVQKALTARSVGEQLHPGDEHP